MSALAWDHNAYYQRLLLCNLPPHRRRVLDVGCGAGAFAAELAPRCDHVDALDRSAEMIELAERIAPDNVMCVLADVLRDPLPAEGYDAIVSISALHHMPLDSALGRLSAALRPPSYGWRGAIVRPAPVARRYEHAENRPRFQHDGMLACAAMRWPLSSP
jgi:SAM-dependent methyltransferase